ncbi:MAG: hypothetical protein JSW27_20320 [Phycisphaerales bacterium]|nr:MAG: hypothetical protein JSW27_20320 [Phycisphaerales bacterium]
MQRGQRVKIEWVLLLATPFLAHPRPTFAFNGHRVTEGPLVLSIDEIESPTQFATPSVVAATVENTADETLFIELRLGDLVDEWHVVGPDVKQVRVDPGRSVGAMFRIAARPGTCSALYPAHIYATFNFDGRTLTAHAVRIFASNFEKAALSSTAPPDLPANVVPRNGALPLRSLATHRVAWQYYDQPLVYMPVGWRGSSAKSAANFSAGRVTRGSTKQALVMHPPWKPGGGTIFAEYRLALPETRPITLLFANAIRDHSAGEPPSDGVTFRVWIDKKAVFERHTDSKQWVDGTVDLSAYAGRQVLLRLESHPGPKRDTTCDSCYWGEPTIVAGRLPDPMPEAAKAQLRNTARTLVTTGKGRGHVFQLDGDLRAAVIPGQTGISDAFIALGNGQACVVFDGLRVSVLGQAVGSRASALGRRGDAVWDADNKGLTVTQPLQLGGTKFDLTIRLWPERAGVRVKVDCPQRITDFALGPADQKAPRVYYGHGYCIVEPEAFRAGFGGHNLSTSHVGFDFKDGLSLLVATDHPPDYLEVTPEDRLYALHTHMDATMTLVPSTDGAFDCAKKYRPLYDKQASPGFERKAGRFVFDIWGGRYADIAQTMQQMIDYGLTDSLLTVHVWQRWGYDYRLPDIYPPAPGLGTVEDMRRIAALCAEHDIPWGLHDNYIDFYPDADGYSYDHICFSEDGQPIKAWLNESRDAQSYRWRPDCFLPFLQRNLRLIKPNLKPTSYFIDVFTSLECFDFFDRSGTFHSMLETRRHWGRAFAWIRDFLGNNAPMTSEAGHDQLIGYLDGADCQHLRITPEAERFCIAIECQDWERAPWYDAVLHDKFSLHGVGYSGRYQGGRSRAEHGIESDDYVNAEILEGHALMIDRPAFGCGAIRKYWLAQDFVRSIALDSIADVRFSDGDIHRQVIDWNGGARVYVNRGSTNWRVAGKVLPPFGYYARNGSIESSIERIDGATVEQSRSQSQWYVNARRFGPAHQLAIRPGIVRAEYLGNRRFKLITNWQTYRSPAKDLAVFIHYTGEKSDRSDKIAFQGGGRLPRPTSEWRGAVPLGDDWITTIPSRCSAGQYEILVGLWDPATGARYSLLGQDDGTLRFRLGTLVAEGRGGRITNVSVVPHESRPTPAELNLGKAPADFGLVRTDGAFRCRRAGDTVVVTPLPELGAFSVALRPSELGFSADRRVRTVLAVDRAGKTIRPVDFETTENGLEFETRGREFAYNIRLEE